MRHRNRDEWPLQGEHAGTVTGGVRRTCATVAVTRGSRRRCAVGTKKSGGRRTGATEADCRICAARTETGGGLNPCAAGT